jgi:hypothetical protein
VVDVRGETGLLTYAGTCWPNNLTLPFPSPGGFSGRVLAGIHATPDSAGAACAFTVAGQWRTFTALPEHFVAGKGCGWRDSPKKQPQDKGEIQVVSNPVDDVKKRERKALFFGS